MKRRKGKRGHPQGGALPASASPPTAREELLALHRKIWEENKRRIDRSAVDDTGELKRYRGAYTRACSGYREVASFPELVTAAVGAEAVYVGDYHTSRQSQKTFLKLLSRMSDQGVPVAVALELVQSRHQDAIDRYLAGRLPEAAFLRAIHFSRSWPFGEWESFRPLFQWASETGSPVLAIDARIEGRDSLRARDRHAGEVIARAMERHPERVMAVLIGDLHIAPSHLPAAVDHARHRLGFPRARRLTVFQNSERIYWRLAARELERSAEVVRVSADSWCVMNTPPIILQQTYLNWLEREEDVLDHAEARAEFLVLLHRIAGFLEIELPRHAEEVELYTCGDLSFLDSLMRRRVFSRREIGEIKRQIRTAESYFIPRSRIVYLANLSINHAAEEASHYLKILCAPEELPRERVAAFYAAALHEAIGFFGSKIINDRRKTPHEEEFQSLLRHPTPFPALARRVARLVLAHRRLEEAVLSGAALDFQEATRIHRQPVDAFIGVTHALGYMLGEKLFYGMVAGTLPKATLRELYYDPLTAPGRARSRYFDLVGRVKDVRIPERT